MTVMSRGSSIHPALAKTKKGKRFENKTTQAVAIADACYSVVTFDSS